MVPILLLGLTAGLLLLALFQWMELLVLDAGGKTVCEVSSTVNCETVWSSKFASGAHRLFQMPIAGLGMVYGLVGFVLSLLFLHRLLGRAPLGGVVTALRLTSLVGILSCVVFAIASVSVGAVCLTCLGTYLLVGGFLIVTWWLLPGPMRPASSQEAKQGVVLALAVAVVAYLLVLPAGLASPKLSAPGESLQKLATANPAASNAAAPGATNTTSAAGGAPGGQMSEREAELAQFLSSLPPNEQLMISRALAMYRAEQQRMPQLPPARFQYGPASAPLRMLEWTDVRCGHCAALVEAMQQVKRAAPSGSFSLEPRHFPLDSTCNQMPGLRQGPGTSCVAAKAQICLEGAPDYWDIQDKLFEAQASLTPEKVMELASSGSMPRGKLQACIDSPETAKRLREDIELGERFGLEGTPLVVLNGKKALPVPSFIYALAVTGGNADSPAFSRLPPPPPIDPNDPHAGHGH